MGRGLFSCFGKRSSHDNSYENATADISSEEQRRGGAVVVELFSSQGCATSPEAELLFSRVGRGDFNLEVPVILLAYHVDYWDYMGWKDPFGSSQWTVRQKAYVEALNLDTMFTPQVVVQGQAQCVANEQDALLSCIASAPRYAAPTFQIAEGRDHGLEEGSFSSGQVADPLRIDSTKNSCPVEKQTDEEKGNILCKLSSTTCKWLPFIEFPNFKPGQGIATEASEEKHS